MTVRNFNLSIVKEGTISIKLSSAKNSISASLKEYSCDIEAILEKMYEKYLFHFLLIILDLRVELIYSKTSFFNEKILF